VKFAVGYPVIEAAEPFSRVVADYRDRIAECYFAWVGGASGRAAFGLRRGARDWEAQARLEADLEAIKRIGVKLDLLFNSACYGGRALSQSLVNETCSLVDYLNGRLGALDVVTTTSPLIARAVKAHFPGIEVRASVNMRIASLEALRYVGDLFDSFYLRRDKQRDIGYVEEVARGCREAGKGVYLLANSGCLRDCPVQTFHDNLVAHDAEIDETRNTEDFIPHACWAWYGRDAEVASRAAAYLQTTWIRPEDLPRYDAFIPLAKLATRMHSHPRMVIHAYCEGRYSGNLLDLPEPCFSSAFAPYALLNERLPPDWFAATSTCDGRCLSCRYCEEAAERALVRMASSLSIDS
jgi:hypothetical protein